MDWSIVDEYERGPEKLARALAGMSAADLQAAPIPGKWSTHQVVIHLADAEAAMIDRMKRILAMDQPPLLAWDENRFAARLHYDKQSSADALETIRLTRRQMARILRALSESDFNRAGVHNERGRQTLADIIRFAGSHLDHHLKFVEEKRAKLGKSAGSAA